jgi:hypothetical protein
VGGPVVGGDGPVLTDRHARWDSEPVGGGAVERVAVTVGPLSRSPADVETLARNGRRPRQERGPLESTHGWRLTGGRDIPLDVSSADRVRREIRRLGSRRAVVLGAVASQVALIGGLLTWGILLGMTATGSLPPAPVGAQITVWVSDPRWHVAPKLVISQGTWTVGLTSTNANSFGRTDPDAEAIIVLWGDARLGDPHSGFLSAGGIAPHAIEQAQIPVSEASPYTGDGSPGSTVPVQVLSITARNYYALGDAVQSSIPASGTPPPDLYAQTSSGWAAYVPGMGPAGIALRGDCHVKASPVPAAIVNMLSGGRRTWYGVTCPPPASIVELDLGENESLGSSTFPPTSLFPTNDNPEWTSSTSANVLLGHLEGFWVDVNDPVIAAAAQRDLLYSGVLYGIAGGILAAWLVAGVTFAVSKATERAAPTEPPDGDAARRPLLEAEQVQGGQQHEGAGALQQPGERIDREPRDGMGQPVEQAAERGAEHAGDDRDRREGGAGGRPARLSGGDDRADRQPQRGGAHDAGTHSAGQDQQPAGRGTEAEPADQPGVRGDEERGGEDAH